jgi:hypothetical protein
MTDTRPFMVHTANDSRDAGHTVRAQSIEDAAFAFVDRWHPPADASGDVVLMITDCENGRRECLRLDLSDGTAAPCD